MHSTVISNYIISTLTFTSSHKAATVLKVLKVAMKVGSHASSLGHNLEER
jgi:hypothetical protein